MSALLGALEVRARVREETLAIQNDKQALEEINQSTERFLEVVNNAVEELKLKRRADVAQSTQAEPGTVPRQTQQNPPKKPDNQPAAEDSFYANRTTPRPSTDKPYTITPPPSMTLPRRWKQMHELSSPSYGHARSSGSGGSRLREGMTIKQAMRAHGSPIPNCTLEELALRMPTSPLTWLGKALAKGRESKTVGKKEGSTRIPRRALPVWR